MRCCSTNVWLFYFFVVVLLDSSSAGWIDPDTPQEHHSIKSLVDDTDLLLVFSDEFEAEGRTFADGHDPKWTSINKNDYTNDALQYYKDERVTTSNGSLNISTINKDISFMAHDADSSKSKLKKMTKNYQSGMVQGWNKFCFTGGVLEVSAKLPGDADIGGLWPAMWLLGNLARATYVGSSDNVWPWSYNTCTRSIQKQQEISACNFVNHFDLKSEQGRGAPEIDILEAMPGKEVLKGTPINKPYFSASLQTSPGVKNDGSRPNTNSRPAKPEKWYHKDIIYGENSSLNIFFYGTRLEYPHSPDRSYQTDAISANHQLSKKHFQKFHKYRLEWATGSEGYLRWYLDDNLLYGITANTLNLTGSVIPDEPSYIIFNTAMSKTWGFPAPCPPGCPCTCFDCRKSECQCGTPSNMCDNFPASFLIDYVRVYQSPDIESQKVGCSTPERPSAKFIKGNAHRYKQVSDDVPLKNIITGGGQCRANEDCSIRSIKGKHVGSGVCHRGMCQCADGFVGPRCLVHEAFDEIQWEPDDSWHQDVRHFYFSLSLKLFCIVFVLLFVVVIYYKRKHDSSRRIGQRVYEPIDSR